VAGAALALAIMLVSAVLATGSAQAQTYTESVLHTFTNAPDGATPVAGLVQDAKGNLYGTTVYGGDSACYPPYGCGTVFKLDTKTGAETVLYSFTGTGGDGAGPFTWLVLDTKGNLYATTEVGGDLSCNAPDGCGTVFKLDTKTGAETVLYTFTTSSDASEPEKGLVRDAQGNLYGTTRYGGAYNYGTIFEIDKTGNETVLYSFPFEWNHASVPVMDAQGNLYGTTKDGGAYNNGTVFMLNTSNVFSVLYSFTGGTDGSVPDAWLLRDAQGNLYGATSEGGDLSCDAPNGCGTLFKLDTSNNESVLYSFTGGAAGYAPGGLTQDAQGNLYGTSAGGDLACNPPNGCGMVFEVDTTGNETVLYSFTGTGGDGMGPDSPILRDTKGNLYGTTTQGGNLSCTTGPGGNGQTLYGCGTVFKLTPATQTKTTTTLTSAPNPSTYGEAVTFTAVVTPAPPDGETVSFMKGKTVLGTGSLSGGTATFVTSTLKVGTTSVTAVYGGDSNFAASKSKPVKQVVEK
jgi:uncharacterized repeat protein (TIGR03803 family)